MSLASPTQPDSRPEISAETAKCRQIIEGARRCFLASGFEAASMGEIAREAKVSKGTLYVYFDSKEALFTALVEQTKRASAERLIELDEHADDDVAATLTDFAIGFIGKLSAPDHVALVRMVIGAAEKFPGIARSFFEAGPAHGAGRLARYFEEQRRRGRLEMADPEAVAWQFLGMCHHPAMTRVVLGARPAPDADETRRIAEAAVAVLLAAYGAKPRP
ncbi:MAG: TetR/AcrR family transcriptional regulator [Amaricoccus sp.]